MQVGSLAEWVGALATFAAVMVALFVAFRDLIKQRNLEKTQQANQVSVWLVQFGAIRKKYYVYISNASQQPIYDVFVSYGVAYGAGDAYQTGEENQTAVLRVPPGDYMVNAPKYQGRGMSMQLGLSVSFRDIRGRYWRRDAKGNLIETKNDSFVELEIAQPFSDWVLLDPVNPITKPD